MAFDAAPRPASRFVTIYVIFIRVRNDVSVCPSLVSFVPRGTKGSIQGKEQRTWEERVVEREAVSRRFNALLEKVFELVYKRLDASRGGKCVVEGKRGCEGISSIPVSPVSSPDDNRQAPPTRELSSFAMHNNLPPYIHIHKWRMHIRDKFPRGVPRLYAPKCKLFSGQIESWRGWQLRVGSRVYGGGEGRVVDRKDWYCRFQILDTPDT